MRWTSRAMSTAVEERGFNQQRTRSSNCAKFGKYLGSCGEIIAVFSEITVPTTSGSSLHIHVV